MSTRDGTELQDQVIETGNELKARLAERGGEMRERAAGAAERAPDR